MRILITGSRGFVGSRLHAKLPEALVIDNKGGQNLLNCSLPDNVDIIYHLAAHKSVEESWQNPQLYLENLAITMRLVDKYPDARIIHASSCASLDPETSPYAFFKDAASKYLKSFHENTVDLLFPNIFGGRQKQNSVVDIFKNAETITVHDPSVVRDYVHVDDIVEGLLKAAEWPVGTYMMGSGIGTSTLELAQATGKEIVNTNKPRSKEPPESIVPNNTPNWKPTISVYEYLKT